MGLGQFPSSLLHATGSHPSQLNVYREQPSPGMHFRNVPFTTVRDQINGSLGAGAGAPFSHPLSRLGRPLSSGAQFPTCSTSKVPPRPWGRLAEQVSLVSWQRTHAQGRTLRSTSRGPSKRDITDTSGLMQSLSGRRWETDIPVSTGTEITSITIGRKVHWTRS